MEMLSFIGVLVGQLIAGYISDLETNSEAIASGILMVLAVAGWLASKTIKVEEQEPSKVDDSVNFVVFLYRSFKWAKGLPGLNYTVFGLACFWLAAALIQMNVLVHAPETYNLSNTQTAIIMSLIAVGIGFGCWVAGMLAKDRVEVGMAPLGGLGLSICMTIFALFEMGLTAFIVILSIAAFFSGFFKVPLGAWIQERVGRKKAWQHSRLYQHDYLPVHPNLCRNIRSLHEVRKHLHGFRSHRNCRLDYDLRHSL